MKILIFTVLVTNSFKSKPMGLLIEKGRQRGYTSTSFLGVFTVTQNFKIKLAAIAKDEGLYLPLWVYHHLNFGFDVLDIRVNNNTDNSVEILEKLKVIYGERINFSFADKELAESRQKDVNFQTYIYGKILNETLKKDFTHLMFLDIDEYWCSANFTSTIKDFLAAGDNFDVCMFQWFMEKPDSQRQINDFSFTPIVIGHKNSHVKSLVNLKATATSVRAHNYIINEGHYILPNKTKIDFPSDDQNRALVPNTLYESHRMQLDEFFVYHKVFRSQEEYLSILLRGNKIDGDDSLLKSNRFGFVPTESEEYDVAWVIDETVLNSYKKGYSQIVNVLKVDLATAATLVLERKNAVLNYLKDDAFLQQVHANKMLGINKELYQPKKISSIFKVKINNLGFDEKSLTCNFDCEIVSANSNYELLITHSTSKTVLATSINLVSEQMSDLVSAKQFHIEIPLSELRALVYKRQPPFCLAAKFAEELILLERGKFRSIAPTLMPHVNRFRKKQGVMADISANKAIETPVPGGFWAKLIGKVLKC